MLCVETRLKPKEFFTMIAGCCSENPAKLRDAPDEETSAWAKAMLEVS